MQSFLLMFINKSKLYTLEDINKQINYLPIIFIAIISFISIIILYFFLENKLQIKISSLKQEESFYKKELLDSYIESIEYSKNVIFDEKEEVLKNSLAEVKGYIKALESKEEITFEDIKPFILHLEEKNSLTFILYNNETYEIYYGKQIIPYFKKLTNSNMRNEVFQARMLEDLEYMGRDNLQYWKERKTNKIRLSYFDSIDSKKWSFGFFSDINDLSLEVKKTIFETILLKSKSIDGNFWFYDYYNNIVYNYNNSAKAKSKEELLEAEINEDDLLILNHKIITDSSNKSIHNFKDFDYLLSVKINFMNKKMDQLNDSFFYQVILYTIFIIAIALSLIVLNLIFTKIVTRVFTRYNKYLESRNRQYKIWKERYELAIIASNDGLWDIDFTNDKIYFSDKWLEMFSYKIGEISSFKEWFALIHLEDQKRVKVVLDEHLNGLESHFICEYRIKNSKNEYQWVLARGKSFEKDNRLDRMVMMSMDINERKNLSKELQYVENLVDAGNFIFFKWKYDNKLSVESVSNSINMFEYTKSDFEDTHIGYFYFVYPDDIKLLKEKIKKAIDLNYDYFEATYRVVTKSDTIKWVFNRAIFVRDHNGEITHFYGYINDITKIKLTQTQLEERVNKEVTKNIEKDRLLVHQNKLASMGEMLGSIAHQWRQPLNNINLLVHYVRDNYSNPLFKKEDLDESIASAKVQIDYMSKTIDDFRNFYQPTKDKVHFSIYSSIYNSSKIVATQYELNKVNLIISQSEIKTFNYENEFQQVIVNILNNACDAAIIKKEKEDFEANVKIDIKKEENNVKIVIENNCGCLKDEYLTKIFEPYFTTKFENQGTGIGLYMSKTIIEKNMKGKIEAKNIKNGIKFIILLPF